MICTMRKKSNRTMPAHIQTYNLSFTGSAPNKLKGQ